MSVNRGATLIELVIAVMIGAIVLMALVIPYAAERSFWHVGSYQAEAQRDADMVLRSMALTARQGQSYTVTNVATNDLKVTFAMPASAGCGSPVYFEGGTAFPSPLNGGQFVWRNGCASPAATVTLIDGVKSKVSAFTPTTIVANKLVKVNLTVIHKNQQTEIMEKQLFLRNG